MPTVYPALDRIVGQHGIAARIGASQDEILKLMVELEARISTLEKRK